MTASRQAFLVIGPHRSGTSALAGALIHLGAAAPRRLMPPQPDNPAGFWESEAICAFHDRLLDQLGSDWSDWTSIHDQLADGGSSDAYLPACRTLIRDEFGDSRVFVIKDPRISRFAGLWLRAFAAEAVEPIVLIVLRNPAEVARSLHDRNHFSALRSTLIWLRHLLDAEADTRSARRQVVRYGDLVTDAEAVLARAIAGTELSTTPAVGEAATKVRPGLRHHEAGLESLDVPGVLSDLARMAWRAFDDVDAPESDRAARAQRTLDQARQALDGAAGAFGWDQQTALEARLSAVEAEHRGLTEQMNGLSEERSHALQALADARAEHAALTSARDAVAAEANRIAAELLAVRRQRDDLAGQLASARARVDGLLRSASWRATAPLRALFRLVTGSPS